jgi:hypothetical protein
MAGASGQLKVRAGALALLSCGAIAGRCIGAAEPGADCQRPDTTASADARRRPGVPPSTAVGTTCDSDSSASGEGRLPEVDATTLPPPSAVPDRWRIVESLGYGVTWLDPYHGGNPVKGDRPIFGGDGFMSLGGAFGSLLESRRVSTAAAGVVDVDGPRTATREELFTSQTLAFDAVAYRGDTVFRPADWQVRASGAYVWSATRANDLTSTSGYFALQNLWAEMHLRDVSANYDFDELRVGVQPLTSDARGFLLSDQPLAVRLYGTRRNNQVQYNLAWMRRLAKGPTGLNDPSIPLPDSQALLATLYWQDLPATGLTSEWVFLYQRNRQPGTAQLLAPGTAPGPAVESAHDFDVGYVGFGLDGHFHRLNSTAVAYAAGGHESQGSFTAQPTTVRAWFAALELSLDFDWSRWRASLLHASGDDDPYDNQARGFDSLNAQPLFAGADSGYFIHERFALAGTGFQLKSRDALLASLRPVSDNGQSEFTNPGLSLAGLGVDLDLTPRWRMSLDANHLWLDEPAVLAALMQRPVSSRDLGQEIALNMFVRPWNNQQLVLRGSGAVLLAGEGYHQLYDGGNPYVVRLQLQLSY